MIIYKIKKLVAKIRGKDELWSINKNKHRIDEIHYVDFDTVDFVDDIGGDNKGDEQ